MNNQFKITLALLVAFFTFSANAQSYTQDQLKARLDSMWESSAYKGLEGLTKKDLKKRPKYDRPDLAAEQDFYMTVDPNTMTVPSHTKYDIMHDVDSINANRYQGYTAITGVNWDERGSDNVGGRTRAIMFDPTDGANGYKKVWAGGVAGGLWYNSDITSSATAWSTVNDFWANMAVTTMAYDPTDDSTFYVGTGEGWYNSDAVRGQGIWKSEDAGQTWSQLASTNNGTYYYIQKLVVTPTGRILAATRSGLFRSDNGGASWSSSGSGVYVDIEIAANGDIYAAKRSGGSDILKSTNDGTTFTSVLPTGAGSIRRIELACAPSDANVVYAVAANTSSGVEWIQKTSNAGSTWTTLTIPTYQNDATKDYTREQAWYDLILAVHPTNSAIVLAGGIDLHKTTNSGTTWAPISHWYGGFSQPEVHADQHAIVFRPGANNAALFGNDGGTYYSSNVGSSSSPSFSHSVNGYNVTQFFSVAMKDSAGSNYMLAGAQDNGTHQFTSPGINSTTEVTGGDGAFCFIDQDNPTYQITSYVRNNWRRSTNGGASFGNITSNSTGRFINPADYDDDANILYAAAGSNEIYRVSGITGTITTSTLTVGGSALAGVQASHLRCSPYSSNVLFVGNGSGGIYKVSNAHTSPTSVDLDPNNDLPSGYISCIEVGATDNQLLVTYSSYGVNSVWETLNGGTSWQSKEGNLPDMPVRWALYNPNDRTQVMLATEVGVWSTNNLGASTVDWDPSNNGLANVRCDMLQIRDSDKEVAIATHARGVFTTNVFGDTSINATFTISSSDICVRNSVTLSSTSSGNAASDVWTITPSTINYINGTSATSESPVVEFTAAGQYTIKLVSSNASGTDIDSTTITNAVNVNGGRVFSNWTQDFDTISAAPVSFIDSIWSLNYGGTYLWEIDSNGTLSNSTGPVEDFSGTGNYLYAEASSPASAGDKAYIQSGCISMPSVGYLVFGFHMYGANMGVLEVEADTGTGWYSQGQISGEQQAADASAWREATLDLSNFNGAVAKLRLSATCGSGYRADIAIDELRFQDGLYVCDSLVAAVCAPTTGNTTLDDGVYGVKVGNVEYMSNGADSDGAYTERICTDTFRVSDQGFRLYVNAGNTYSNRVRVYIDYNNDGQFDTTNEMVWYSPLVSGYRNDTITVPTIGVVKGKVLRMRIMADDINIPNEPCGTLQHGESEDFGITIEDNTCELTSFSLGNDTAQCGGSVSVSAGTYSEYLWSTGATTSSISVATTGDYSVQVVNANGCIGSDTMRVAVNSVPTVDLGNDITQCGGNVTIDAGSFAGYAWSNGTTSQNITTSTSGTFSVVVTDANGCEDTDEITVSIYTPETDFLPTTSDLCVGDILDAGAGSGYAWSTGATSQIVAVSTSNTYSVTKLDANGCLVSDNTVVTIVPLPVAGFTFSIYNKSSSGFKSDFTNTSSNQDRVSWDFGNGSTSDQNSPTANFNIGSYDVRLIVFNDCGSDTLVQVVAYTASVSELEGSSIHVYPNPATDVLNVISVGNQSLDGITVYDIYGKQILSWESSVNSTEKVVLSTSDFASGTYYVAITSSEANIVKRVVVTK